MAVDPVAGRFAVADGATTSARPEVWSELLVDAFVRKGLDPLAPDVLTELRARWRESVTHAALPWFARTKLQQGGSATFVGLHLDYATRTFRASAVGDSCLFQLRAGRLRFAGPITRSDEFSQYPALLSTRPGTEQAVQANVWNRRYRPGDVFVLATDAVASFLLLVHETHGRVPPVLELARSREQFGRYVARYRHRQLMPNDDASLCVVET